MSTALGRLKKIDLRAAWLSECSDFTPWLAQEENLKLLGETIGIELELESQEKWVGPFRADILCKDLSKDTDNWVLIENQLERTDHCHLGQLITYAAGLHAVTIVWISQRFTDEHRAALDWLNERTDEHINFFGLEVELWQIGDSPPAPKFNIVSQPNDWSRTIKDVAEGKTTETQELQLEFWTGFSGYMEQQKSFLRCRRPMARSYMSIGMGRVGFKLKAVASTWNSETEEYSPEIRAEFVFTRSLAKKHFALFEAKKAEIEAQLGFPLVWRNPPDLAMCRAYARQDADITNKSLWPQHFAWLKDRLERMHKVFSPLVRTVKIEDEDEAEEDET